MRKNLRASIDLGTNTCLLLIAEIVVEMKGGSPPILTEIEDHSSIVRLGEGVDQHRALQPQAIERTMECLIKYAKAVRARGIDPKDTVALATSQARDAKNGADFFARVERETGFRFKIISGEEEANLTFWGGLLPGLSPELSAVIDIGGGSTEYIAHVSGQSAGQSVDMGSVRFTERYLKSDPVTDDEFWACQAAIDQALLPLKAWRSHLKSETQLIAVAGTAATLGAWYLALERFEAAKLNQLTLTRGDIHRMVEELKWRTVKERSLLPGMEPKRADVLLAGALILWRSMEILDFPACRISTRGLRYGALTALGTLI